MGDLLQKNNAAKYNCINLEFFLNHTDFTALVLYSDVFCFATEETHSEKSSRRLLASFHYLEYRYYFAKLKWKFAPTKMKIAVGIILENDISPCSNRNGSLPYLSVWSFTHLLVAQQLPSRNYSS